MPSPHIGIREVGPSFFNTGKGQGMKYEVRERILKVQGTKYEVQYTEYYDTGVSVFSYATGRLVEPRRWMDWQVHIPASVSLFIGSE